MRSAINRSDIKEANMKKILRLLKKRNNRGFTLVEVIISCALLGILVIGMCGFVAPVLSQIKDREQNAHALMISEAMQAYINRSIKNSNYVAIFENVTRADMISTGDAKDIDAVKDMFEFVRKAENKDIYEIKCIGIRWLEDKKTNRHRYMLTNEYFSSTGYYLDAASTTRMVFDECFYDNSFPKVTLDILTKDSKNTAIKTIIDVYENQDLDKLDFEGIGYADLININNTKINQYGTYKLYSKADTTIRTADEFAADHADDNVMPDTYIYYITRKVKIITTTP